MYFFVRILPTAKLKIEKHGALIMMKKGGGRKNIKNNL